MHLEVRVTPNHPSVLTLGTERVGSGTLVEEDLVFTVNSITLGAAAVTVTGPRGRRANGEVMPRDFDRGLALVKTPRGPGPLWRSPWTYTAATGTGCSGTAGS